MNEQLQHQSQERNEIVDKYKLKFRSENQQNLFFEMFNTLIFARTRNVRDTSNLDIEISLAALCRLGWPGKSPTYRYEIRRITSLYYSRPNSRRMILTLLRHRTTLKFRRANTKDIFFININDFLNM